MGSYSMSEIKVLHIAPTPLVGAPGKIACAQRMKGYDASAVALSDYPKGGALEKIFIDQTLIFDEFMRSSIEDNVRRADVIHIHNYLPDDKITWLRDLNQTANYFYQAHSPLREGPLYWARAEGEVPFEFKARMCQNVKLKR